MTEVADTLPLSLRPHPRHTPSLLAIAEHWRGQPEWPEYPGNGPLGLAQPFCAGCHWLVPEPEPALTAEVEDRRRRVLEMRDERLLDTLEVARRLAHLDAQLDAINRGLGLAEQWRWASRWIDRAHLVDHVHDGRDAPANMVPLCHLCHRAMPPFRVGEAAGALAWVRARPRRPDWWQLSTSAAALVGGPLLGPSPRRRLRRLWDWTCEQVARELSTEQPAVGA